MEPRQISPKQIIFPDPKDGALRPPPNPKNEKEWAEFLNLKANIKHHGLTDMFSVKPTPEGNYCVLNGSRRSLALKQLCDEGDPNFQQVWVNVVEVGDLDALERQIAGNATVAPTKAAQYAAALQKLAIHREYDVKQLAAVAGKSESYISQLLKINQLPKEICQAVDDKKISVVNAIALTKLPEDMNIYDYVESAATDDSKTFTTKVTEAIAKRNKALSDARKGVAPEFAATPKFIGKESCVQKYEQSKVVLEQGDTEFNRGYALAYAEIFQMDEPTVAIRKTQWDKEQKEKDKKAEDRKRQREEDKKVAAAKYLKEHGITTLDEVEVG